MYFGHLCLVLGLFLLFRCNCLFRWILSHWTSNSFEVTIFIFSDLCFYLSMQCNSVFLHSMSITSHSFRYLFLLGGLFVCFGDGGFAYIFFSFHSFEFLLGYFQLTTAKFLPSFTSISNLLVIPNKHILHFVSDKLILILHLTLFAN